MPEYRKSAAIAILSLVLPVLNACSDTPNENVHIGYVEADWIYVSAPQSGWIKTRPAIDGAKVSAGDILFTLDNERQQASIAEANSRISQASAEAQNIASGARAPEIRALQAQLGETSALLAQARSERNRIMPLVQQGIESRSRGDQVEANLRAAQARVNNAREQIRIASLAGRPANQSAARANIEAARAVKNSASYELDQRTIKSQVDAIVSETFQKPGEFVNAGNPVLALLPKDGLKVRFFVNQRQLPGYKVGQTVTVNADGISSPVKAKVSYIATEAEFTPPVIYSKDARGKLVFLIEATVPATSQLKPGLPVDISDHD